MAIGLGVDHLNRHSDVVRGTPDAPFQHITHAEFATNLLCADRLVSVSERSMARYNETVRNPRQIGRQILSNPICKILLIGILAEIGKGQHNDR